jgi:glycosyltransferase involved in cell wall biosynthesis
VRVLAVLSHPVQYFSPVFRLYEADPRLEFTAAYCSMHGVERSPDPEFGQEVAWDVPLLEGHSWVELPNRAARPRINRFFGQINPGLVRLITRNRWDVVVVFGYSTISQWLAIAAARLTRTPYAIVTDSTSLTAFPIPEWKARLKRRLVPAIYRAADAVFSMSSRSHGHMLELGVAPERVHVTPYVVDNGFFAERCAAADGGALRAANGLTGDRLLVLFCGKLVPWKRPADIIEAVALVPEADLILAGDGPLRPALAELAERLGAADRVHFAGFVNQSALPSYYKGADVLTLVSDYDAFGLVVNEAFNCGTPAIVSDSCGAADDLVEDGRSGFVVPTGDVGALADRLRLLAADPALRTRLGEGARARIGSWGPEDNARTFVAACTATARTRTERS